MKQKTIKELEQLYYQELELLSEWYNLAKTTNEKVRIHNAIENFQRNKESLIVSEKKELLVYLIEQAREEIKKCKITKN